MLGMRSSTAEKNQGGRLGCLDGDHGNAREKRIAFGLEKKKSRYVGLLVAFTGNDSNGELPRTMKRP